MKDEIKKKVSKSELRRMKRQCTKRNNKLQRGTPWYFFDFFVFMLTVATFAFAARAVIVEPVRVRGSSMEDTLYEGDYMVVEKLSYLIREPKRGDIVIIWYPNYDEFTCVKRVIGVGGDHVVMKSGENGYVSVNGVILDEPYISSMNVHDRDEVVPEGCVYVLGDNRTVSKDSSNDLVGNIPVQNIVGRVCCIAWPAERISSVG
ncbi:MAG: signal peptidase I [Clostridia bacterium]|nr:signal peptidase I [Clostridia bacterium]